MNDVWIAAVIPSLVSGIGALIISRQQLAANLKNDTRIEELKSKLARLTDRRRTLFERRANVLATVYSKLVDAHEAFDDFLASGTRWASSPSPEQRHRAAVEAGEYYRKAYTRSRILIPEALTQILDELNKEFVSISNAYAGGRFSGKDENAALMEAYDKTEGTIKTALAKVDIAFREAIDQP